MVANSVYEYSDRYSMVHLAVRRYNPRALARGTEVAELRFTSFILPFPEDANLSTIYFIVIKVYTDKGGI